MMKWLKIVFLLVYTTTLSAQVDAPPVVSKLKPTAAQGKISELVTQFLSYYHFLNKTIKYDDSLSNKVFQNYLEEIDGSKFYFTQEDIDSFERFRFQFDDFLSNGQLNVPFDIYNQFLDRQKERSAYTQKLLKEKFDFTIDESIETDRDKITRPKNSAELDETWRKLLKNQALDLKLSGKSDSAVYATLIERYKNIDKRMAKKKPEDVFQEYINAFTESLDPHTNYFNPSNADAFKIEMAQSLEGIGATLNNEGDYVKIVDLVIGGPAARSGLVTKNDKIVGVAQGENGAFQDIIGWLTNDAVKLIRGPKGTTVKLQLIPADSPAGSAPKEIKLIREKIKLEDQVCKKEVLKINQNKKEFTIGVVEVPLFYRDFENARRGADFQSTTRDAKRLIEELKKENIDGLVVDLRNNGGGSLTEAINLTGLFISKGPVVQRKDNKGGVSVEGDTDTGISWDGPLTVLINRMSASASEIFAGAIQDYKRGVVVGEQSFGKGTVQQLIDLDQFAPNAARVASRNGGGGAANREDAERYGQLKLTTEKFYRINGSSTQRKGVMPDINFPSPYAPEEFGESSQKSALVWDEVNTATFETKAISEKQYQKLKDKYNSRLKSDPDLKQANIDIEEFKKLKEQTIVSLNETSRKKEREGIEEKRKAISKLNNSKDKDIFLAETARITADLAVLLK